MKKRSHSPAIVRFAPLILLVCGLAVITAMLFFQKQAVEAEKSLAPDQVGAAMAKIIAPCQREASLYGVKATEIREIFTDSIRTNNRFEISGTDANRVRSKTRALTLAVQNQQDEARDARITFKKPITKQAVIQTVLLDFDETFTSNSEGNTSLPTANPLAMNMKFSDAQGNSTYSATLRVQKSRTDNKKLEASGSFTTQTAQGEQIGLFPGTTFPAGKPLKLRFFRSGEYNEYINFAAKSEDGTDGPFTLVMQRYAPEYEFVEPTLSLQALRSPGGPAVRIRTDLRNFRVFCPPANYQPGIDGGLFLLDDSQDQ